MAKNGNKRPSFVAVLEDDNSMLSCTQYDVYVALLSYCDSAGMAWPSIKGIQERMRVRRDRRTVMRALRRLEELGKLDTWVGGGPNGANVYYFKVVTAPLSQEGRATKHALRDTGGGRADGAKGEGSHSVPSEVHIEVQEEKSKDLLIKEEESAALVLPQYEVVDGEVVELNARGRAWQRWSWLPQLKETA